MLDVAHAPAIRHRVAGAPEDMGIVIDVVGQTDPAPRIALFGATFLIAWAMAWEPTPT
jgi:hypothetical protein